MTPLLFCPLVGTAVAFPRLYGMFGTDLLAFPLLPYALAGTDVDVGYATTRWHMVVSGRLSLSVRTRQVLSYARPMECPVLTTLRYILLRVCYGTPGAGRLYAAARCERSGTDVLYVATRALRC